MELKLTQESIINYEGIEQKAEEVKNRLSIINIENLVINEDSVKDIKKTRAELKKEFEDFENARKFIKEKVVKPYNDFEVKYKMISEQYKSADKALKNGIDEVTAEITKRKLDGIKAYFEEVNTHDFITYEKLGIIFTNSESDIKIKKSILDTLNQIDNELSTLESLPNSSRILAKYQLDLDLTNAISTVNRELAREKAIEEAKAKETLTEVARKEAETVQENLEEEISDSALVINEPTVSEMERVQKDPDEVLSISYRVIGIRKDLKQIVNFMNELDVKIEELR